MHSLVCRVVLVMQTLSSNNNNSSNCYCQVIVLLDKIIANDKLWEIEGNIAHFCPCWCMDEQFSSIIDLVDDSVVLYFMVHMLLPMHFCDIMNVHLNNYFLS